MMVTNKIKQSLNVYLHNQRVGKLVYDNAVLNFVYDTGYVQHQSAQKLSISLPLQDELFDHQTSSAFFSGLLPDESVRTCLAKYLKLSEKNIFGLLKAIGGECAGAVSVYSENQSPSLNVENRYRVLDQEEANEILLTLDKHPMLAGEKNIRISGAGAQSKLMIAFVNRKIAIPMGNTPSTHIIKPAIKNVEASIYNEYFCMELANLIKLPVPNVQIY